MKHLGIDVHLKSTEICELSEKGKVLLRDRVATTQSGYRAYFGRRKRRRIAMESGPSTPWVHRLLTELGHEVIVLNPRRNRLIAESALKSDRIDAEILARLSRFHEGLLQPVYQRRYVSQELRTRLKVRQSLVRCRAKLITTIRGCLRAHGYRLRSCASKGFVACWTEADMREGLRQALDPLVETIAELTDRIAILQKALYAEAKNDELLGRLQEVPGVGPIVALAFMGWVDCPERFDTSRDVGASLGLRPKLRSSGDRVYRGRITRSGDSEMRWLLVQAAHASFQSTQELP